jgi:hypothetical protein
MENSQHSRAVTQERAIERFRRKLSAGLSRGYLRVQIMSYKIKKPDVIAVQAEAIQKLFEENLAATESIAIALEAPHIYMSEEVARIAETQNAKIAEITRSLDLEWMSTAARLAEINDSIRADAVTAAVIAQMEFLENAAKPIEELAALANFAAWSAENEIRTVLSKKIEEIEKLNTSLFAVTAVANLNDFAAQVSGMSTNQFEFLQSQFGNNLMLGSMSSMALSLEDLRASNAEVDSAAVLSAATMEVEKHSEGLVLVGSYYEQDLPKAPLLLPFDGLVIGELGTEGLAIIDSIKNILATSQPDLIRLLANQLRELIRKLIDYFASSNEVLEWITDKSDVENGRPTRRARIRYLCRNRNSVAMQRFLSKDTESLLEFIDCLQKLVHGKSVQWDRLAALSIASRAEKWIELILLVGRK